MQDRLNDLMAMRVSGDFNELQEVNIDVDPNDMPAGLQNFNDKVEEIKRELTTIRANTGILAQGYKSLLLAANTEELERNNNQMEAYTESIIKNVGQELKTMAEENKSIEDHNRWRTNVHSLLTKQFMEILLNYRDMQTTCEEKVKERIRARVKIVNPQASPQEIEGIVESSGKNLNIFAQELANQHYPQAKEALTFVEERHREILRIENSVIELHQLFNDMAALVNLQGEFLDNIEENVSNSKAHVAEANLQLASALRKKTRKRWCLCITCLIFLILIAIGITLGLVGKSSGWW